MESDLTVAEVAEMFQRKPVTVRRWIREGRLQAYRFQGREYRIPRQAVENFQRLEAAKGPRDLGDV